LATVVLSNIRFSSISKAAIGSLPENMGFRVARVYNHSF